jgi:hypothetical protein
MNTSEQDVRSQFEVLKGITYTRNQKVYWLSLPRILNPNCKCLNVEVNVQMSEMAASVAIER